MNAPRRPSSAVMDWSGGYGWVGGVPLKATLKDFLMKITHSFWPSKSININSARSKGLRVYFLLLFILQWVQNFEKSYFDFYTKENFMRKELTSLRIRQNWPVFCIYSKSIEVEYIFSGLFHPAVFSNFNNLEWRHVKK